MNLAPYPEYKDAGLSWLDKIPSHWEEKRAKFYFREIDERSLDGNEELLSVSHVTGVTPRSEKNITMFKAESYVGSKICHPGDLVINTMWAWMAALGVAKHCGIVSSSYHVYRPRNSENFISDYIDHLLRTWVYAVEYRIRSTGIRPSRLRLYPDKFLDIPIICPPLDEQKAIVSFIKMMNNKISYFIKSKKKILQLLAEKRQVATDNAIKSPETKKIRLGVVADKIERQVERSSESLYTPVGLYNRGRGIFHKPPTMGNELGDSNFYWIREGDLVISGQFAWEGAVAIAQEEDNNCIASHRYPIFRGKTAFVDPAYLVSFFQSELGNLILDFHSRGAAGRNRPLNARTLVKEKIPIPPLDVQEQFTELLDLEISVSKTTKQLVKLLMEYRNRLTSDVVTGKVDVRDVPLEPVEEMDHVEDFEEIQEDEELTELQEVTDVD
jgi:type I restriction enzyme S subunit